VNATDNNGCSGIASVTVGVDARPFANAGPDLTICSGETTRLQPSAFDASWNCTWSPALYLSNANIPNPIFNGPVTTIYTMTIRVPNSVCPAAIDTVIINVNPIPPVDAGRDTTITPGTSVQLNATGGATIIWYPSTGLSCSTCFNPVAMPQQTTTYFVTTFDANGCPNSDTVTIFVDDLMTLYIPNAFTPHNLNRPNPVFYAYGVGIYEFEFYIFNRWGEMIFETNDINKGWNGIYRGSPVMEDVYVYVAKARSITGKSITRTGTVTVVK
jgi:gliding motility-associated-like protein